MDFSDFNQNTKLFFKKPLKQLICPPKNMKNHRVCMKLSGKIKMHEWFHIMKQIQCSQWKKLNDFYTTQILRQINFWDYRSAKSALLTHLEAKICDFNDFLHFLKTEITNLIIFRAATIDKTAILESQKLISRKILVIEKL